MTKGSDSLKTLGFVKTFAIILVLFLLMTFNVAAQEVDLPQVPEDEWKDFEDSVPDSVKDKLYGDSMDNGEEFAQNVSQMSKGDYIASVIFDIVGIELGGALRLFFALCALIILSAIFATFGESVGNSALSSAIRFCSSGALISVVIYTQYEHFERLENFFDELGGMMSGMIPVTASIWAMGGNVSTASAGSASFGVILAVSEALCSNTVIPICCILTVFGFCDSLNDEIKMGRVVGAVKKIYVFVLGMVMTVLLSSLGAQTALASSADTTAARTARLVSGSVIPVVGGSVGETFRTVSAGVGYLKSIFGIGAIIMIVLLMLPVMVSVLLTRFVFLLCAGFADMLGCANEARMLDNLGEIYGLMLGVVVCVAVIFILALYIFMRTVVAVA